MPGICSKVKSEFVGICGRPLLGEKHYLKRRGGGGGGGGDSFLKTQPQKIGNSKHQQGYGIDRYPPQPRHIEGQYTIVGHSEEKNEEPGNQLEGVPGPAPTVVAWVGNLTHHWGVMVRTRGALEL